jgi:hypothetical protein|tara:strand:- start:587 stop:814 length:228 start_codon:yes stop_codon:yes gene_type:complete
MMKTIREVLPCATIAAITFRNSSSADEVAFEKLWPSLQKTFDDSAKERLFLLYVQGISEGIKHAVRSIEKRLESK